MRHSLTSSHFCVELFRVIDDDARVDRKILWRHFRRTQNNKNMTFDHIFMARFLLHFIDKISRVQKRNFHLHTQQKTTLVVTCEIRKYEF